MLSQREEAYHTKIMENLIIQRRNIHIQIYILTKEPRLLTYAIVALYCLAYNRLLDPKP